MNSNSAQFAQAIEQAKLGEASAERFLRLRMRTMAEGMPTELLIALSEIAIDFRKKELRDEAQLN